LLIFTGETCSPKADIKASNGEPYEYPLTLKILQ